MNYPAGRKTFSGEFGGLNLDYYLVLAAPGSGKVL